MINLELFVKDMDINNIVNLSDVDENGIPSTNEIEKIIMYIFYNKNIHFLEGIKNIISKIYDIPFEIRHRRSKHIKNSIYKTDLSEKIRQILLHRYEYYGLLEKEYNRYETTHLFYNYVDEFGLKKTKENIGRFLSRYREEAIKLIKLNNKKININKRIKEMDKLISRYGNIVEHQ